MGRLRTEEDQSQRMRELEELEAELDLASSTVETTVPKKRPRSGGLNYGKIALIALAVGLLTSWLRNAILGLLIGGSFLIFLVFGILWLVRVFGKKGADEE